MASASPEQGLYVALQVAPDRDLRRYIKDIPHGIGDPIEAHQLFITCMYPEELAVCGLASYEREALEEVVHPAVMRALGRIQLAGSVSQTCYDGLADRKQFAAIELTPSEEMLNARKAAVKKVREVMGIRLPSANPNGWFVNVAERGNRHGNMGQYKRRLPWQVTVSGVTVDVRDVGEIIENQARHYSPGQYSNLPRTRRRQRVNP